MDNKKRMAIQAVATLIQNANIKDSLQEKSTRDRQKMYAYRDSTVIRVPELSEHVLLDPFRIPYHHTNLSFPITFLDLYSSLVLYSED